MIKIVNQMINNTRPSFAFKNVKPAKSHGYNWAPIWITPTPLQRLEPSANQIITKSSIIRLHRPFPRKGKTAQVEGKNTCTFDNIPHTVKKWSPVSIAAPKNMEQTFFQWSVSSCPVCRATSRGHVTPTVSYNGRYCLKGRGQRRRGACDQ